MNRTRARAAPLDPVCASAVDLARAAVVDVVGADDVGEHLGAEAEDDRVVAHYFACQKPAYRGWRWVVTLARAARGKNATVNETVLVPGPDALLAPAWVPWRERLRPGDVGVGDLLPTRVDDERLVPGFTETAEDSDQQLFWELGLGRARVLSAYGRDLTAQRWYYGEHGPHTPLAQAAPAHCSACGFFVPLAGALRQLFGVCTNEYAADDGRVVSADHGCGAHSEAVAIPPPAEPAPPIVNELGYEVVGREEENPSTTASGP